tara:strand:- start:109 stop:564 length:456 start_codon:yes stop_codon:yes gene_type:complete
MGFTPNISSYLGPSLGLDELASQGLVDDAKGFTTDIAGQRDTHRAGLQAEGLIAAAKANAEAQTSAAGSSAMSSALSGGLSGLTSFVGGMNLGGADKVSGGDFVDDKMYGFSDMNHTSPEMWSSQGGFGTRFAGDAMKNFSFLPAGTTFGY